MDFYADPFLLTHNLGAGVDDQMAAFIKTALVKGRNIIGCPPAGLSPKYTSWRQYFFDPQLLTQGLPPTGRGCRLCGKIGHKVKNCPDIKRSQKKPKAPRTQNNRHNFNN